MQKLLRMLLLASFPTRPINSWRETLLLLDAKPLEKRLFEWNRYRQSRPITRMQPFWLVINSRLVNRKWNSQHVESKRPIRSCLQSWNRCNASYDILVWNEVMKGCRRSKIISLLHGVLNIARCDPHLSLLIVACFMPLSAGNPFATTSTANLTNI
jgi:hypothetical protein